VPLSSFQSEILQLLAGLRAPDSYVAGASALNRGASRYSRDIDFFHDREEAVAIAAQRDAERLGEAGLVVHWLRREPGIHIAEVRRASESMRLEWVRDSDFRFFPVASDPQFGYVLHPIDIATNKALAAAGRREPRDVLDLLYIHDCILPLAAVVWAAVGKDPGFSPESLISEIRRNARYRSDDFADIDSAEPIDAALVSRTLRTVLEEAESFVRSMPAGKEGLLFLEDGKAVLPDPARIDHFTTRAACRGGHWPSTPEISGDMLRK
jgi:hypothetical protein